MPTILEPTDLMRMLAQFEDRLEREPIRKRCPTCGRETVNRSMSAAVNVRAHISRGAWMMIDDDGYQLWTCGRCVASPSSLVAEGAGPGNSAPDADPADYAHPSDYAHWSLREGWWKRRRHTAYWTGDLSDPTGG